MAKTVGDFCILQLEAELAGSKKHMAIEGNFMALCNKDLQSILSEERCDNDVPGCAMCFCIFAHFVATGWRLSIFFGHPD